MKAKQLRQTFIDFFKKQKHQSIKASPVVLAEDPTLLFVNAGMNQFKDVLLGTGKRSYKRAVNSQVCIRVSGKHNDLEDVGKDSTHLTSFEMLGNWSFGDYSKQEAITWAWQFLTTVLKLPKQYLYASVHKNDSESLAIWQQKTDINPKHIVKCDDKDNFWEMGNTGPCGPCSEIHFDTAKAPLCDPNDPVDGVNGSSGRVVELWNLVFVQSERLENGQLIPLKQSHVDTGAGFERLLTVLQHKQSVYETDVLYPLIQHIEKSSHQAYIANHKGTAHRVIADHVRTLCIAMADNVLPSNEGRGYVLRRLLRRASRYARQLNHTKPFIYTLVETVAEFWGDQFPQVRERQSFIKDLIKSEEEQFLRTLDNGLQLFETLKNNLIEKNKSLIAGIDAFKLYDTFGFPLDLTQVLAAENQLNVDINGFNKALKAQKDQSRNAQKKAAVDPEQRGSGGEARLVTSKADIKGMSQHHSATHVLHAVLRDVLGTHVVQAGSLVDIDHLRFDFTHHKALNEDQLQDVEKQINHHIQAKIPVCIDTKPYKQAISEGAMALFGEKYGDTVRVVTMGDVSSECCIGHHVKNTNDIEVFKIISETAVAAGTRRIEAIAGNQALSKYQQTQINNWIKKITDKETQCHKLAISKLPSNKPSVLSSAEISQLQAYYEKLTELIKKEEKNKQKNQLGQANDQSKQLLKHFKTNGSCHILQAFLKDLELHVLKNIADQLAIQHPVTIILLGGKNGALFVKVSKKAIEQGYHAGQIIKQVADICDAKGGGRPDSAQGGGANIETVAWALASVADYVLKTKSPNEQ